MDLDLAINNGTVIDACGIFTANVGVRAGKIAVLYERPLEARRVVDATGQWVLPGVIDPHVHFALRQGQGKNAIMTEDDYETGPIAAAVGGVTTFIDFGIAPCDVSPREYIETRIALAEAGSCIDFGFHAGVCTSDPGVLEEFPGIVERGIPSFKFFVTYKKWGFAVDLGFLLSAMQRLQELNGIACLHAEHDEILEYLRNGNADQESLMYHSWTRPDFSEEISVYDAVVLARETKCNLYIVHLSTEKALDVVRRAQASNISVRAETCPHYLAFTDEVFREERGLLYTMTPPLRPPGNSEALWDGIRDGTLCIVSSDHNALSAEVKLSRPHWLEVPPGIGGSEMLLTFMHSEGVATGRIQPEHMVKLLSAGPARTFGISNKGSIRVGFDADMVVFDPNEKRVVHHEDLATQTGFTIYEGWEMTGWPTYTIARGEVLVENRNFIGSPGRGNFLERRLNDSSDWLRQ